MYDPPHTSDVKKRRGFMILPTLRRGRRKSSAGSKQKRSQANRAVRSAMTTQAHCAHGMFFFTLGLYSESPGAPDLQSATPLLPNSDHSSGKWKANLNPS